MQPFPTAFGLPPVGLPIQMRPQILPLMGIPRGPGPVPYVTYAAPPPAQIPMLARPITAGPVLAPNLTEQKAITLYVGHLSSKVKDEFFKTLLSYCGSQRSWKRVTSSFGFVEFQNPDGALRAIRVLGDRELFGKKLLINADKKTKEVLDQYIEDVKAGRVQPMTHPGVSIRGKSGEEIMKSQDVVAENLIAGLLGYEERSQAIISGEQGSEAEKEKPSKSRSASKSRSKSSVRVKVLPPSSSVGKRSSSRRRRRHSISRERSKRSRSHSERSPGRRSPRRHSSRDSRRERRRSPSPPVQSSREHRRRDRDRSESPARRSSRERRKERKKRKKQRRKRSASSENEKRKRHKETKTHKSENKLPEPGADDAPKTARDLVGYIPKDQTKLLKYPIDWDLIDSNEVVEKVMRGWIDSRIKEYLGEEEADLTNFAVGLLTHHMPPKDIITEMEVVLVEDSEGFVVKMWRRMIFESLKIKYKIC